MWTSHSTENNERDRYFYNAGAVQSEVTVLRQEMFGFHQFKPFTGWFDLAVEKDAAVLAHIRVDVSDTDYEILQLLGVPKTLQREQSDQYYFAGNIYASKINCI